MGMRDRLRVAVLPDFREEGWPSMDRVADELLRSLSRHHTARIRAEVVRPRFQPRAVGVCDCAVSVKVDRGLNRFIDYPRHLAKAARYFDIFHVVDHSYAQLVHRLPANRTVVTCHDLDAFRAVLDPHATRRSWAFRAMTRHLLEGLRRAACVTCDSAVVREELLDRVRLPPDRVVVVPIGVSDVFSAESDPGRDRSVTHLLGQPGGAVEILHVGGVAPRKRVDVLIACLAAVRGHVPHLRLIHVGDPFTSEQQRQLRDLGLGDSVIAPQSVDDQGLAALYRRAALVLVPSEREGFGLPVAEALASGTPVVASDLPVLREVGGAAATYCPVGDVSTWTWKVLGLLGERTQQPDRWAERRAEGIGWAARFTWARYADRCAAIYDDLAQAASAVDRSVSITCPA